MPPSRSEDEHSGSRLSGTYIDIDIESNLVLSKAGVMESKRSHTSRSDGHRPLAPTRSGATELHINLQIEVGDRRFYLHKFPLLSKSGRLNGLVFESRNTERDLIVLSDIPGGAPAFEFIARQFYGGKGELSAHNVAAIRCAAEYLEITEEGGSNSGLVNMTEEYLNREVASSWRDSITVLKSCADLHPWAEDLEIVRRCSESIARKCGETRKGRDGDWWFPDVCSLSIHAFSRVIHAMTAKGYTNLVASVVGYYAERWLQLTKGSDMSTTLKLTSTTTKEADSPQAASFMAFTGFNQDIVAKDARQTQHKNRAILQGIVNLLPPVTRTSPASSSSLSVKFLLKLLRVACLVNAGSFCKTDLAKRIASQLDKVSLDDLLIPSSGDHTYDVDVVQQIFEYYVQEQSWGNSPPFSPRSSVSGQSSTSRSVTSSGSSSNLSLSSGSSGTTRSRRGRSVSSDSGSDSDSSSSSSSRSRSRSRNSRGRSRSVSSRSRHSRRSRRSRRLSNRSSSETGSSISGSSTTLSSSSRSTTSESSATSVGASSDTGSSSSSSSSSSGISSDESVKLDEKKKEFYLTESSPSRKTLLPPSTANFKVAQLLETYLEEVAKDSSIGFGQFMTLAELFTEFPRDSDDSIYRTIDGFLRTHPSLSETERKSLCRLMDPGALSLAACVHAASNERLPLRVIVQLLFSEQIKLRNEMTGNDVINEKDLGSKLPSFSTSTTSSSSLESSSDAASSITLSSGSSSTSSSSISGKSSRRSSRSRSSSTSLSVSSASALNEVAATARSPSVESSGLLNGLSVKETLLFVLAEIGSLRKSTLEIESVKSRLRAMETLQSDMDNLTAKFQEMSVDYLGMTLQVEELTRGSKHAKSGWSSGWKKVTKSFQSKDTDLKNETPPLPPVKLNPADFPELPILRTKSETIYTKTPRVDISSAQFKSTLHADSLPISRVKTDPIPLHPKTPRADSLPQMPLPKTPKATPDLPKRGEMAKTGTPRESFKAEVVVKSEATPPSTSKRGEMAKTGTPRESFKAEVVVKSEAPPPSTSKRGDGNPKPGSALQTPRESFKEAQQEKSETITAPVKGKEQYAVNARRSQQFDETERRPVRSRSRSPKYVRSRQYRDSDSATSTSSYSRSSSGKQYSHGSKEKHHSRSHRAERSSSHGGRSEKHRQKESSSHNGQSLVSSDSHAARHSSATHQSHQSRQSGHHRHAREGSSTSHHTGSEHQSGGHRRSKDYPREIRSHRRRESRSDDSGASSGGFEAPRRRSHRG